MMSMRERFDPCTLQREAEKILRKYPDRLPVILENNEHNPVPRLEKNKYLAPRDITLAQFMCVVRKRMQLNPNEAIFIFFNNTIVPSTYTMEQIYEQHKDKSGFLIGILSEES